jgi:hypothetical protein
MTPAPIMTSVYSGRTCIGFALARGKHDVEAFTADQQSLGFFASVPEAANAIADHYQQKEPSSEKAA